MRSPENFAQKMMRLVSRKQGEDRWLRDQIKTDQVTHDDNISHEDSAGTLKKRKDEYKISLQEEQHKKDKFLEEKYGVPAHVVKKTVAGINEQDLIKAGVKDYREYLALQYKKELAAKAVQEQEEVRELAETHKEIDQAA